MHLDPTNGHGRSHYMKLCSLSNWCTVQKEESQSRFWCEGCVNRHRLTIRIVQMNVGSWTKLRDRELPVVSAWARRWLGKLTPSAPWAPWALSRRGWMNKYNWCNFYYNLHVQASLNLRVGATTSIRTLARLVHSRVGLCTAPSCAVARS